MKCTCGLIFCECARISQHYTGCGLRLALRCPIGFECEHGYDICPQCDPCTCDDPKVVAQELLLEAML